MSEEETVQDLCDLQAGQLSLADELTIEMAETGTHLSAVEKQALRNNRKIAAERLMRECGTESISQVLAEDVEQAERLKAEQAENERAEREAEKREKEKWDKGLEGLGSEILTVVEASNVSFPILPCSAAVAARKNDAFAFKLPNKKH